MEFLPEAIQSQVALFAVAGFTGSDMVRDALDDIAGRASVVDMQGFRDDMIPGEVVGGSAIHTLLLLVQHLLILSEDIGPFHCSRL